MNAYTTIYRRSYTKTRAFKDRRNAQLKEKRRIAREKREAEKLRAEKEKEIAQNQEFYGDFVQTL